MTDDMIKPAEAETSAPQPRTKLRALLLWGRRVHFARRFAIGLSLAAVASGVATLTALTGSGPTGFEPRLVQALLVLDVLLLLSLGAVVSAKVAAMWAAGRKGRAGSRLQARLVLMLSLVAATPAILVGIFAALFLNLGVDAWFSDRVRTAVAESDAVAQAYQQEHLQTIRADVLAVASDLNRNAAALAGSPRQLTLFLDSHAAVRSIPEAMVIAGDGRVLGRSSLTFALEFEQIPEEAFEKADQHEVVILTDPSDDRVRALTRLDRFVDAYLLVSRYIDPAVVERIKRTRSAVEDYQSLEKRRLTIFVPFVIIFGLTALLLLLAAAWFGMTMAGQLTDPIGRLIGAAERISKGDLSVRVTEAATGDEIGMLSRAFNRMTGQLETQRQGLVAANRELDERRHFTETVLAGVSAGVIGLDREGRVHLPNRSASILLDRPLEDMRDTPLAEAVPEMADLLLQAMKNPARAVDAEIRRERTGGAQQTLRVTIASERLGDSVIGYVVTFDDITALLSAQRKAAWADVAQRIAHEIRNPLTPIQLATERLRRKYAKEIQSDPETFNTCTETIIRQVTDIGRMVDEFSAFARMPKMVLASENLSELCHQTAFLERNRNPAIRFEIDLPERDVMHRLDARQMGRALTNLLKNASESVLAAEETADPWIGLSLSHGDEAVKITIEDNGKGFPPELKDRLTEPYVTTRAKGTGLGLAIVKKIMEDHGGDLILENREGGGARAVMVLPLREDGNDNEDGHKDPMDVATGLVTYGV